jgi:Putative zinc- or iron-chelating domain
MFLQYPQLLKKIDAFVGEIYAKHPTSFVCKPGCAACCVAGISIWRIEYDFIKASRITHSPTSADEKSCPFLDANKRCTIYDVRPIVCRLWGAPLFYHDAGSSDGRLSAPKNRVARNDGVLTCCSLNFTESPKLDELPQADVLSVEVALSTLAAINHVYCKQKGSDPAKRLSLADALL